MSEETKMEIRIQFLIHTHGLEASENMTSPIYEEFLNLITDIPNAKVNITTAELIHCIEDQLFIMCTNNTADIIIITGDDEYTDNERDYTNKAIESIIVDRRKFSTELANLIAQIEQKLEEITQYTTRCGVHNKILLVHLPGTNEEKEKCMEVISNLLVNAIHLIHKNENLSLSYTACSSDNNFPEQEQENANKSLGESSSSLTASVDSASIKSTSDNDFPEQEQEDANKNLGESSSSPTSTDSASIKNISDSDTFPTVPINIALSIMTDVAESQDTINELSESINISDAYGRISLESIYSKYNVPSFRTSSKHGYAVLVKDGKGIRKVQRRENTFPLLPLQPGTCVWVNSGAPIPDEATAVIQEKDTKSLTGSSNDNSEYIKIMIEPQHGQNIKIVGHHMKKNKLIVNEFTRIGAEEIGLLAMSGLEKIKVSKQMSIGVLSIGDNLEEPGEPLKPGFVYDINRMTLISLLKHNDYPSLDFGIVNNEVSSIQEKIKKALEKVDVLVTTGSINDKDLLKDILTKYFEAEIHFGNVNIKPGRSTTLATCKIIDKKKYLMCLSGNPMSALIAAYVFLLPFVHKLHRYKKTEYAIIPVQADTPFRLYHRPRVAWTRLQWVDGNAKILSMCNLYNDRLSNIENSHALLILPAKEKNTQLLPIGTKVLALLLEYPKNYNRIYHLSNYLDL